VRSKPESLQREPRFARSRRTPFAVPHQSAPSLASLRSNSFQ